MHHSSSSFTTSLSEMKILILISVCFTLGGLAHGLRLPKIFKSGMVLQANPTSAVIWGFLDGNSDPVDIGASCHFRDKTVAFKRQYVPEQVSFVA